MRELELVGSSRSRLAQGQESDPGSQQGWVFLAHRIHRCLEVEEHLEACNCGH